VNGAQLLHSTLHNALETDPAVQVLGESLELSPVTQGLLQAFPQRVHLLPATDRSLVGLAIGMAFGGKRPVLELASPTSLWSMLPQLAQDASQRSNTSEYRVPLVVRVPVAPGEALPTAALMAIPGLIVAVPSSAEDSASLLKHALSSDGPVVILESQRFWRAQVNPDPESTRGFGEATTVASGNAATVIAWGEGVASATTAADKARSQGVHVDVLDLGTLSPLDTEAIKHSVCKTGRPIVVNLSDDTTANGPLLATVHTAFLHLESPPEITNSTPQSIGEAITESVQY